MEINNNGNFEITPEEMESIKQALENYDYIRNYLPGNAQYAFMQLNRMGKIKSVANEIHMINHLMTKTGIIGKTK